MDRLRHRADFLAAASGAKAHAAGFVLQARVRDASVARVGFTVSRKVGHATERNRVRRRLREIVRLAPADAFRDTMDYVLIGRQQALKLPFDRLAADLAPALARVHRGGPENKKR